MFFKVTMVLMFIAHMQASGNGFQPEVEALIRTVFDNVDSIQRETVILSDSESIRVQSKTGSVFDNGLVEIVTVYHQGLIIGFGLIDSIQSKSSVLPLLVITDKTGVILSIGLLSLPDPHSAKLQSRFWKNQFVGKKEIHIRQIDAVSGATVSSRDITLGVMRLLYYLKITGKAQEGY